VNGWTESTIDLLDQNGPKGIAAFLLQSAFLELFGKSLESSGSGLGHRIGRYRG
jgi:hypothetical protein